MTEDGQIRTLEMMQKRALDEMMVILKGCIESQYLDIVSRLDDPLKEFYEMKANDSIDKITMRLSLKLPYSSWLNTDSRLLVVHTYLQIARVALIQAREILEGRSDRGKLERYLRE